MGNMFGHGAKHNKIIVAYLILNVLVVRVGAHDVHGVLLHTPYTPPSPAVMLSNRLKDGIVPIVFAERTDIEMTRMEEHLSWVNFYVNK